MCKTIQKQCFSFVLALVLIFLSVPNAWPAFTIEDEKKLGREIYDKLDRNAFLLKDPKLNAYVTGIGNRLLAHSTQAPFAFTFSVFNSSGINAFATPGGYIYINSGLITAVENEAQLAGVMAHEIAHANCRHVASIIEKSQKLNIAMLAAIIAGAFIGGGGDASAAIAAFSMAGASSMSLKYQREHEEEADRLGIATLVDSGYYPAAMVEFLRIIKQYEFFSKSIPSYLRTHPGTDDRIFYLDSLLQTQYRRTKGLSNIVGNFVRMQALLGQNTAELHKRRQQLLAAVEKDPQNVDLLYALGLTEDQLGRPQTALDYLARALARRPQDADVLKSIGLIYLKTGDAGQARAYLLQAAKSAPEDEEILLALGRAHYAAGDFHNALACFLKLRDKTSDDANVMYHIAMSYGKLNQAGESHYYFGLYFQKEKKSDSALFHFQKAQAYFPEGSPRASAIADAIRQLNAGKTKKTDRTPPSEAKYF
ncbi:MAG: M48 family metalloprotease [Syntrophaceae bacterium]|jgi:predicted Zn-dependent protease|nr:M48 family metalloprotease [Syntrophaceae bacterium]